METKKPNFLFEKLNKMEDKLNRLYQEHREPHYNPWELAVNPVEGYELIWRYNNTYTRNMKELYEVVSTSIVNPEALVKYPTFCKYVCDEAKCG